MSKKTENLEAELQQLRTENGRLKKEKADLEAVVALKEGVEVNEGTLVRIVNGALRSTINAHGPITLSLIGSASKRITGDINGMIRSLRGSDK